MSSVKFVRACAAVRIRYPIFQVIGSRKVPFILLSMVFVAALVYAILWACSVPQDYFGITGVTGVPDNLFSTIIEIAALISIGSGFLIFKTYSTSENNRINNDNDEIPDSLIFPISPSTQIKMSFLFGEHYACPPILEACLRWLELDRDEFFLVEAGSLDIPKLTLRSVTADSSSGTLLLKLGSSSFFDVFYTHYSPDLILSSLSVTEKNEPTSLRTVFGPSIENYYKKQLSERPDNGLELQCSNLLPNPFGISGIVLLTTETSTFVLLRKRLPHEIAAKNRLEWSFAGLVEATSWVHSSTIDFEEFANSEFQDEVVMNAGILSGSDFKIEPIGLVFNPLYLYQPEMFVAVRYPSITDEIIAKLSNSLNGRFLVVPVAQLSDEFSKHKLKNLCRPGLKLLHLAYPELFSPPTFVHRTDSSVFNQ